jgi:chromosome segregation ATPase
VTTFPLLTTVLARLIKTLNDVHFRLEHLEEENSISRRRVRELEYELEECKREVVRERTRWQEESAELSGVIQAANLARALGKKSSKGKGRAKESVSGYSAINKITMLTCNHGGRRPRRQQILVLQRKDIAELLRRRKVRVSCPSQEMLAHCACNQLSKH